MIWVSWRLHRAHLLTMLGVLVAGAGAIVVLRSAVLDDLASTGLASCVSQTLDKCSPSGAAKSFGEKWSTPFDIARAVILCTPALIGAFVGAPLFARELEQGTHVLAFTQSVSRTRWMAGKLLVALVPALAVLIVLQALVSWWLSAAGILGPFVNGPFTAFNFGIGNVSPVGYALFAFALGTFLGVATRRTLVAMTGGLAAFVVVRLALAGLVDRLVPAQRLEVTPDHPVTVHQDGSLVLGEGWLDAAGQPVSDDRAQALIQACKTTTGGASNTQEGYLACLPKSGLAKRYADFVPESQAWQVHLADLAIYGGLAVLLLAGTAWVLRRQS
ncbi:ABC transporter permease [Amycolatopsis solani]|uniref:ABC transporter permease n=1 Tax=Amycolatopsis solani TaxID=3028615 RepID=UPI0025B06CD1|nr:ABC transporter permease [Amycolatopsis sp. MEP2-6]